MPWQCNCGTVNSAVNERCAASKYYETEHYQVSNTTFDFMLMLKATKEFDKMAEVDRMTPEEKKFQDFFNSEMLLFSSMTELEQIEHIKELEEIAFEAKARLTAAKTAQRDKAAKSKSSQWSITPTTPDQTVTDTINRVKLRASRMSKLDKTRENLKSMLGLSDAEADAMVDKMRVHARKDNFAGDKKPVTKPAEQPSRPLDLSTLNFKKGE